MPGQLDDRTNMEDCLFLQKHVTERYNVYAYETTSDQLRNAYLQIHGQEQQNAKKVFDAMHGKGWYKPAQADPREVDKFRRDMESMASKMQQPTA